MPRRSLSVLTASVVVVGALLSPVAAGTAAAATGGGQVASGAQTTFKSSVSQRRARTEHQRAVAAAAAKRPAPAPAPSYADRVLAATNAERTKAGLAPLAASGCAAGYAQSWSAALARAGSLSHQPLRPVLTGCAARTVGENVAFGNVGPEEMVGMWMRSAGHRANILNPRYTHLGVGQTTTGSGRVYGVQVFLGL
jgi:uncharacterized protein YkwD